MPIRPDDPAELERVAHRDSSPRYQVRRARVVPGVGMGRPRERLACRPGCAGPAVRRTCQLYRASGLTGSLADGGPGRSGRDPGITPAQRAQVVGLACPEPVARGPHITHWSSTDLARRAVADGAAARVSPSAARGILHGVDPQPHRTRCWEAARPDGQFKRGAGQVLWRHANAARPAERGTWVACVDEAPTSQALGRRPTRRATPGSIGRREFDYARHGAVNAPVFLAAHSGLMELALLAKGGREHYPPGLGLFRRRHKEPRGVSLIQDGGPSHVAGGTRR